MRAPAIRAKVEHLLDQVPFRPFIISLENGQTITIEHPENIAFEPGPEGSQDFYVLGKGLHFYSSFSAVSSIALLDEHASVGDDAA